MIKISANLSKKVPMPGLQYSSQQHGASMEIEISDADRPEAIKARIQEVYALLSQTVDEQIAGAAVPGNTPQPQLPAPSRQQSPAAPPQSNGRRYPQQNGRSNGGRPVTATVAQQGALYAISKSMNLDLAAILASYNVSDASQLTIRDASKLIDDLKQQQQSRSAAKMLAGAIADKELARLREFRTKESDDVLDDPGAIRELTGALKMLHARGFKTPTSGGLGTVLAEFCEWAEPGAVLPAGYEESVQVWSGQHPLLALFAIRALPKRLPNSLIPTLLKLLEHPDRAVQLEACRYVAKTKDVRFSDAVVRTLICERQSWVLREAHTAACVTGKRLEAAQALADRIADDEVFGVAFAELLNVIRKTEMSGDSPPGSRAKRIAIRDTWRKIFADPKQCELIRNCERLDITEDEANTLLGGEYFFDLPDGTQWPAKKSTTSQAP